MSTDVTPKPEPAEELSVEAIANHIAHRAAADKSMAGYPLAAAIAAALRREREARDEALREVANLRRALALAKAQRDHAVNGAPSRREELLRMVCALLASGLKWSIDTLVYEATGKLEQFDRVLDAAAREE